MKKCRHTLWIVLLALCSTGYLQAEQKTVNFTIGLSLGPYILPNGDGILGDIIKESLSQNGYRITFAFNSNAGAIKAYSNKQFDAVAITKPGLAPGYLSGPVISFHNRLITLQSSGIKISSLNDIKDYRVIGFSNASRFMGPKFKQAVALTKEYEEMENQQQQVEALLTGKVDIILADEKIFEFYRKRLRYKYPKKPQFLKSIEYKYYFAPSYYYIAFHDEKVKSAFDDGFKKLTQSGRVDSIYNHYSGLLVSY